jgi:hypothetical protein
MVHKLAELKRKIEGHDGAIHSLFKAIRQLMAPCSRYAAEGNRLARAECSLLPRSHKESEKRTSLKTCPRRQKTRDRQEVLIAEYNWDFRGLAGQPIVWSFLSDFPPCLLRSWIKRWLFANRNEPSYVLTLIREYLVSR